MPDVLSMGIGGGSIVRTDPDLMVGPDCVGYRLTDRGPLCSVATFSPLPTSHRGRGMAEVGDPAKVRDSLDRGMVTDAVPWIREPARRALDRMKAGPEPVPVVLVGGGSILVGDDLPGASEVIRPDHFAVANAIGAAIAQVGGQVERIVKFDDIPRADAIEEVRREAVERCVAAGADGTRSGSSTLKKCRWRIFRPMPFESR